MPPLIPFFLVAQVVKASAGFQALADGLPEVQLAGMAAPLAPGGELPVDLTGDLLDHGNGFGDFRVPELRNIPVKDAQLRVQLLCAHPGILHEHLLLHQRPGKHGMDKLAIEFGVPFRRAAVLLHEISQPLAGLLRHGGIGFPLLFIQVHGLTVDLQFLLRLLAVLGQLLLPLLLFLRLLAHPLF